MKYSGYGIASLVIGILWCFVGYLLMFIYGFAGGQDGIGAYTFFLGVPFVGFLLGVAGTLQKDRRRNLAWIGGGINLVYFVWFLLWVFGVNVPSWIFLFG